MTPSVSALPLVRSRKWRVVAVALVLVLIPVGWLTSRQGADAAVPPAPNGLRLIFSDDFTGAAGSRINEANWLYDIGHGYPGGAPNWGTGEIERMTDSTANVSLDGKGNLAIRPVKEANGEWTSGRIETKRTDFAAPVGGKLRIEGRIQQPDVNGAEADAYWPAFWAMGEAARPVGATNWPGIGEWDIMEAINGRPSFFHAMHCGVAPGGPCNEFTGLGSGEKQCPTCKTQFHTYAVEYDRGSTPEKLTWFFDGAATFTVTSAQMDATTWNNATHHGMFVILNVAMGGGFPGAFGPGLPTGSTKSGVPMLVDYVAVYQSGAGNPSQGAAPQPPTAAPQPPTAAPQPPTAAPQPPTAAPQPSGSSSPQPPAGCSSPQPPASSAPQPPAGSPQPPAGTTTPQPPTGAPQPTASTAPQPPASTAPQPPTGGGRYTY